MTLRDNVLLALRSTESYLELLEQQNLGIQRVGVVQVPTIDPKHEYIAGAVRICAHYHTSPYLRIESDQTVAYVESQAPNRTEALVVDYDRRTGDLKLAFKEDRLPTSPGRIETDLRWLIRQQLDWLRERGGTVGSPFRSIARANLLDSLMARRIVASRPEAFSDNQREALEIALSSSLTYVWGPPGTGKTTRVLTVLLRILLDLGKRVLLVAPTNTALDNALLAALKQMTDQERKWVARLGSSPSRDLFKAYPDVCEDASIKQELKAIETDLEKLSLQLAIVERIGKLRRNADESSAKLSEVAGEKERLDLAVAEHLTRQSSLEDAVRLSERRVADAESELRQARRDAMRIGFWAGLFTDKRAVASAQVEQCNASVHSVSNRLQQTQQDLAVCVADRRTAADEAAFVAQRLAELNADLMETNSRLGREDPSVATLDLTRLRALYQEIRDTQCRLTVRRQTLKASLDDKRVIAVTLDGFVSRFRDSGLRVDWAILDEAGYAHLVKAIPLLSLQCPITMLGDHKQLEPVAEVRTDDKLVAAFWRRSAVHLEQMLRKQVLPEPQARQPHEDDIEDEAVAPTVDFGRTKVAFLNESFRFSDDLAAVLCTHVYNSSPFRGSAKDPTRFFRVEVVAVADPSGTKRVNRSEADTVAKLIEQIEPEFAGSIAVLTPYKNQSIAIQRRLAARGFSHVDVLNVHKAQGREWDAVVFSAVDGTLPLCKPYFTSSRLPEGTIILNTAISRVRKALYIVCERGFWRYSERGFLGDLVRLAEDYGERNALDATQG